MAVLSLREVDAMRTGLLFLIMLLSAAGVCHALDCAASAYTSSCSKCSFDSSGKMNQTCYQEWQNWGTKCIAEKRPMLANAYHDGLCSEVDACKKQLQTCQSSSSAGSDKLDCLNPMVGQCYLEADACVADAEKTCDAGIGMTVDGFLNWCPFPVFMVLLLIAGFVYSSKS
jgi:hypothetical protein